MVIIMEDIENLDLLVSESKEYSLESMAKIEIDTKREKFYKFFLERKSDSTVMDVAIQYSEMFGIEIETVAEFIKTNDVLLSQIRIEAEEINMIEKLDRLPV